MRARLREILPDVRAMLHIAIPLALAELGWVAMGVVDILVVGRLPDSAVAIGAASLGNALFFSFAIFGFGLMSGLDTLVSHAFGAQDWPSARRSLAAGMALAIATAPLLIPLILSAVPLLGVLGVAEQVRGPAADYIGVLVWSLPPLLFYAVFRRYLQGIHFVRPVTFALVTANLVNLLGNWLFVFGNWGMPAMGLRGSAVSTVVARVYLAAGLAVAVYWRDPAAFRQLRPDRERIKALFQLGLPAAVTIGMEVGVFNAATALAAKLDAVSLAAHTIALNAASIAYMVPLGISSAAAVSVGRHLGARDRNGAGRAGWVAIGLTVVWEIVTSACFLLFPRQIGRAFTHDEQVVRFAVTLLAIAAIFQLCDGLQTVTTGALRGLGNTRTPMIWNLVGYWVIGLPLGYWLCFVQGWGAAGLWDGLCVALILIGLGLTAEWRTASKAVGTGSKAAVDA